MNRIAEIILDLAVVSWILFVLIAVIMTISSCNNNSAHTLEYDKMSINCENCDEIN